MAQAKSRVQSASKVFSILEAFVDNPSRELSISELADLLKWNRTTVYRFIQTLIDEGYVKLNPENNKYCLTYKIVYLSNKMINKLDVRKISYPYMYDLARKWQLNCHLAMLDGNEIVFLERINCDNLFGTTFHIGRRAPVHATAIGKAIISTQDSNTINIYLQNYNFTKYSPYTITDKEAFLRELLEISQTGYSIDQGEYNYDIHCIASPIRDINGEAIAGISISGQEKLMNAFSIKDLGESVIEAARKISHDLGYIEQIR